MIFWVFSKLKDSVTLWWGVLNSSSTPRNLLATCLAGFVLIHILIPSVSCSEWGYWSDSGCISSAQYTTFNFQLFGHAQQRSWDDCYLQQGWLFPLLVTCSKFKKLLYGRMLTWHRVANLLQCTCQGRDCIFLQISPLAYKGGILHPQDPFQSCVGPVGSRIGSVCLKGRGRHKTAEQEAESLSEMLQMNNREV